MINPYQSADAKRLRRYALLGLLGVALAVQGCTNDNGGGSTNGGKEPAARNESDSQPETTNSEKNEAAGGKDAVSASGPLFPARLAEGGALYGYVDAGGRPVIPASYDYAYAFQDEGWAEAYANNELVLIDRSGDDWFRLPDGYIEGSGDGRIVAANGSIAVLLDSANRRKLLETHNGMFAPRDGRILFSERDEEGTASYGYLDLDGNVVIPAIYARAELFRDGKAVVKTADGAFLLIDKSGESVTVFEEDTFEVTGYGDGMVVIRPDEGGPAGFAAEDGTVAIEPKYRYADPFRNGLAAIAYMEGDRLRNGVIDQRGAEIIPPEYDVLYRVGNGWFALGNADENAVYSYRLADGEGKLTEGVYRSISESNGQIYVFDGERTYFVGEDGAAVTNMPSFDGDARLVAHDGYIEATALGRMSVVGRDGALLWKETRSAELPDGLRITERLARDGALRYIYYPEIDGIADEAAEEALNERFRAETEARLASYRPDDTASEEDAQWLAHTEAAGDFAYAGTFGRVLVMKREGYEYNHGAAHGMPWQSYDHIDLETGAAYGLNDLMTEDGLGELERRLREQAESPEDPEEPSYDLTYWEGVTGESGFYIEDGEIVLYFHPYEIAAYAAGFPEFRFALTELETWIDRNGAFWQSLNG